MLGHPRYRLRRALRRINRPAYDWWSDRYHFKWHHRPANPFRWTRIQPCRERKVECGRAVIGNELFIFAGYHETLDQVSNLIEIYDLANERWKLPISFKAGLPHSHHGMDTDEKQFVYLAGGQIGPQASPCTAQVSVFDSQSRTWASLPPLPEPRYDPVVGLLDGKLHVVAGAMPDRFAHACEHWSLAVKDGRALEQEWREEPSIPHGGHHRASAVIKDKLFTLGGQERDLRPISGDPKFTCDWNTPVEIMYRDVYSYCSRKQRWKSLAPLPLIETHAEFSVFPKGKYIVLLGGLESRTSLVAAIQVYDTESDQWKVAGYLPYPLKGHVASLYQDTVFVFAGQRSVSATDSRPGDVLRSGWKAKLPDLDALFADNQDGGEGRLGALNSF